MAFQKHLRANLYSGFCSYPQMAILMMTHKKLFEMFQNPVALTLISCLKVTLLDAVNCVVLSEGFWKLIAEEDSEWLRSRKYLLLPVAC